MGIIHTVGEDLFYFAKNTSGQTICTGDAVVTTGSTRKGQVTIKKMEAANISDGSLLLGIADQKIEHNRSGYIMQYMGSHYPGEEMSEQRITHKFAWLPVKTTNGQLIWFAPYVQTSKLIRGLAGESPVEVEVQIFKPEEYTFWLLTQAK